ncbi:unnamed protein product [Ectocarpus sp. 4 AP-2014]
MLEAFLRNGRNPAAPTYTPGNSESYSCVAWLPLSSPLPWLHHIDCFCAPRGFQRERETIHWGV